MTVTLSTGFATNMAGDVGGRLMLSNCVLAYFTGAQPLTADAPPTTGSQRIIEFTKSGGVYTAETKAAWKIVLSGTSGTLDSLKIGGAAGWGILGAVITYTTDLTTTAALAATQINSYIGNVGFTATSSGANLYVYAPRGSGALLNGLALTAGATTLVATVGGDGTPSGSSGTVGVTAVNGCNFLAPVAGLISKESTVWQGVGGYNRAGSAISGFTSGNLTAGWCRIYCDPLDDDSQSTAFARIDMSINTANADIIANPTAIIPWNSTQPINTFSFTMPFHS